MTYDDEQQRAARLRMENAQMALSDYTTSSRVTEIEPEFLRRLKEEVRNATRDFLNRMNV